MSSSPDSLLELVLFQPQIFIVFFSIFSMSSKKLDRDLTGTHYVSDSEVSLNSFEISFILLCMNASRILTFSCFFSRMKKSRKLHHLQGK